MLINSANMQVKRSQKVAVNSMQTSGMAIWIIVLILLAYPLLGTLIAFTSLPSSVASWPVRGLVLVFSLLIILKSKNSAVRNFNFKIIGFFWLLYFIRLLWDLAIVQIPLAGDFMFSFIFFTIVPAVALMHVRTIDEHKLSALLLYFGSLICVLAIIATYTNAAASRSFTEDAEGRLFLDTVNPITYGHVGVTTIIAALARIRYCIKKSDWIIVVGALLLGAFTIQLSGSRGPLVTLLLCIFALSIFNKPFRWLLFPVLGVVILFFAGTFAESENILTSRIASTLQRDNTEVRVVMQAGAIQQFLDSPFFGSAIIEFEFQDYPHNIIIESAMALGVVGFLLIGYITFVSLRGISRNFKIGHILLPGLSLQYIVASQFSGSIALSNSMWLFTIIMLLNSNFYKAR
jgi:hypothetical protein